MESKGWIKLHRRLTHWKWYKNPNVSRVFIHILLKSNHQVTNWKKMRIEAGQWVTSRRSIAEQLDISEQKVRSALGTLKSTNEITIKSSRKGTVISVINWDLYQQNNPQNNPQINQQPTSNKKGKEYKEGDRLIFNPNLF